MTSKQISKFLRSEEFYQKSKLAYPFGYDDKDDAQWERIILISREIDAAKKAWNDYRDANPLTMGYVNANDSVVEKYFELESLSYWVCCLDSAIECENNSY